MERTEEPVLKALSRNECLEHLRHSSVGRVGVSIGALPVVLPVNYVVHREDVVFRTVRGTKLDTAIAGSVVAFEVDAYAPDGSSGWSVMVQGRASEITEPALLDAARLLPLRSWALGGTADRYVRVETGRITGRSFHTDRAATSGDVAR